MTQTEMSWLVRQLYHHRKRSNEPLDREAMLAYFQASIISRLILAGCRTEYKESEPVIILASAIDKIMEEPYPFQHGGKMKEKSLEYTSEDIQLVLSGMRIRLDCGHRCTIGHNFANTLIINSLGGGRLETCCHSCY